ncbi:E set domain-containing protein [Amniculicola lignicola CBS 123094]|uniref:E set domain-containing protein n=1 Tax=Amniculicola lignicola CBS 123094 TaxID=1392246 RepID=A0A6A5VT92_9PLEO|nr:E set domain-containing protein [Amniculicola lignicola CBS 123094]
MAGDHHDDELAPEQTEGFKVGQKKTIEEYNQLDQNDESLRKWKESLGISANSISDPNDPRKCIIYSLGLEVEGRPDIVIDLKEPGALATLKEHPFTIKEGATFRMKVTFKVQHNVLSGLKYVQLVKRGPIRSKMQEMIVSVHKRHNRRLF